MTIPMTPEYRAQIAEMLAQPYPQAMATRASASAVLAAARALLDELVQCETQLAEVRKQHQPGPALHAWRRPDGRRVHGDQDWIRASVQAHGGEHVTAETCSYVGQWKAAEQQPEHSGTTCAFPGCVHPDHQRKQQPEDGDRG